MCGIAGFFSLDKSPESGEQLLEKMQQALEHRGPNGHALWQSSDRQVGFVHRRLSIIDLSSAANQPMMDAEKTVVITFNGEIYNHRELRAELELLGHRYFSNSDTETIIHAYKQWGIDCVKRFDGMFAFALFDIKKNECYVVRDRIGIKPLYFSLQGGFMSFASEIKALWPLPWISKKINQHAISHYLTFMVTPAPLTLYESIYKLPAGFYAKIDASKMVTFHEWYNLLMPSTVYSKRELNDEQFCVGQIRSLLRQSVKQQMIADVPFGVFLSGGIDSSLNVALMSEFTDQVKTFNVSFSDGPESCEQEWARKVARRFNTQHHEIVISEKEAFQFFNKMVYHQDEPLGDCVCIPLYYVSKLLRESGVTVVQVGEGSDELFCGYQSYANYLNVYRRYWRPAQLMPQFARSGFYFAARTLFGHKPNHVDKVGNFAKERHLFWTGTQPFSALEKKKFLYVGDDQKTYDPVVERIYPGLQQSGDSYDYVAYHLNKLYAINPQADFYTSMAYLEFKQRLPELLLMRVDKMAMATSVEGRVPFLDHKLVEFAFQIPTDFKYKNGVTKYILKKACEGILPDEIIYRKKVGFAAPTTRWFKQGVYFRPYFEQLAHKHSEIFESVNHGMVKKLFEKNKNSSTDRALQLWVLQNLMAVKEV